MLLDLSQALVTASEGVDAQIAQANANTLNVTYDFPAGGFFTVRLPVSIALPENFKFTLGIAGDECVSTVEVKMFDPGQENVWWVERRDLAIDKTSRRLTNKKRHFSYAWGPSHEPLSQVAFIEVTIKSGTLRHGTVILTDPAFEELAPAAAGNAPSSVAATSGIESAKLLLAGKGSWRSDDGEEQTLTLLFDGTHEFGGLVVDWGAHFAIEYEVHVLGAGTWRKVDTVSGATGKRQYHLLPDGEGEAIRLRMVRAAGRGYEIEAVSVKPLEFGATVNDFLLTVAGDFPLGHLPRYARRQQPYWTVVGVSGATNEGLLGEDGAFEMGRQGASIEPFIWSEGRLLTWADGEHTHALPDGYLPLPVVHRRHEHLTLTVQACAVGESNSSTAYVRYTVHNTSNIRQKGRLFLAARSWQVNPPWQFLNKPGGFAPIRQISSTACGININGRTVVCVPRTNKADSHGTSFLAAGDVTEYLARGIVPRQPRVSDPHGFAGAALAFDFDLPAGCKQTIYVAVPLSDLSVIESPARAFARAKRWWKRKLASVNLTIGGASDMVDTIKSQIAYLLINREGPAIQPGKRSYMRTWIRDGALTCAAFLQYGLVQEVKDFILWFTPHIYANGKVPCCVDKRGADPTPENDSPGEWLYMVAQYYRYTGDKELLKSVFPYVKRVVGFIDELRQTQRTAEFRRSANKHLFGLLPPSISHEGYSDKPAYSHFDNIFADVGLACARYLAAEMGDEKCRDWVSSIYSEFHSDLVASIYRVVADRDLQYVPASADRGDFDPTSTTIALDPDNLLPELERLLRYTFERYWTELEGRIKGGDWSAYTPYELRSVGALLRLGERDRAHSALAFFMQHRRPSGWNHWAEVVCRDSREAKFLGDMPHGWVGSDFLRSVRSLLVYERAGELIVGHGLTGEWLRAGVKAVNLCTPFGTLHLKAHQPDKKARYVLTGEVNAPVRLVVPPGFTRARADGRPLPIDAAGGTVLVSVLPAKIVFFN
jgi:hypothetical protein